MKALVLLLLLFGTAAAKRAPAAPVTVVTRLPATGLDLDSGWCYQAGDNFAWKSPAYADAQWPAVDPSQRVPALPVPLQRLSRGWLRLHLRVGPALSKRPLMLLVSQAVASEVYLDGQLLARTGRLAGPSGPTWAYNQPLEPIALPIADERPHVVAVRFAWPTLLASYNGNNYPPLFWARLVGAPELAHFLLEKSQRQNLYMVAVGGLVLLTLMHLVLFAHNARRPANLYFAVYTLCNACIGTSLAFYSVRTGPLAYVLVCGTLHTWVLLAGLLGALRALYAAFDVPLDGAFRALGLLAGLSALLNVWAFAGVFNSNMIYAAMLLLTAAQVRVSWRAAREGKRGAGIVATGFTVNFITVALAAAIAAGYAASLGVWPEAVSRIVDFLSKQFFLLGPAVALSLFLAREAALDRQLLRQQLRQVEKLSAEAAVQQHEKQLLLAEQNQTLEAEVGRRTAALQASLQRLRSTQALLVEREKLASLGALTAGIAHEIQNPLNFVTNFADVSGELVAELEDKQHQPSRDWADEADLLSGLKQNLRKISQHGGRAAAIVRGMLGHSSPSTGPREAVDLNMLCNECLHLAYQTQQAQSPAFTAVLHPALEPGLPPAEGVRADLGRVLLNLFANAFYAMLHRQQTGEPGYVPTLHVQTQQTDAQVLVRVSDNGGGMSATVQAQVFQPFFTTKPPGEGTGMGLSLSYDIVARGHGGTLTVENTPEQGATFTMALPARCRA